MDLNYFFLLIMPLNLPPFFYIHSDSVKKKTTVYKNTKQTKGTCIKKQVRAEMSLDIPTVARVDSVLNKECHAVYSSLQRCRTRLPLAFFLPLSPGKSLSDDPLSCVFLGICLLPL